MGAPTSRSSAFPDNPALPKQKTLYFLFKLPDDYTRVKLSSIDDEPGSDYINANYIHVSLIFLCKIHQPRSTFCYLLTK